MVANAADAAGKRQLIAYDVEGLQELAFSDQAHVVPGVQVDGAPVDAGRYFPVYGVRGGDGLGEIDVGPAPARKSFVVIGRNFEGTVRRAQPARRALLFHDPSRPSLDDGSEVAGLTFEGHYLAAHEELHVRVPPHLHELRRHDAHGAVIGRECLVELRHLAADVRLLIDQVDLEAGFDEVEGSLHPPDAASDHQYFSHFFHNRCYLFLKTGCLASNPAISTAFLLTRSRRWAKTRDLSMESCAESDATVSSFMLKASNMRAFS